MRHQFRCDHCGGRYGAQVRSSMAITRSSTSSELVNRLAATGAGGVRRRRTCRVCGGTYTTVELTETALGTLLGLSSEPPPRLHPEDAKDTAATTDRAISLAVVAHELGRSVAELSDWLRLFPRAPGDDFTMLTDREAAALGAMFVAGKGLSRKRREQLLAETAHRPPVDPDWAVLRRGVDATVLPAPRDVGVRESWHRDGRVWFAAPFVAAMRTATAADGDPARRPRE